MRRTARVETTRTLANGISIVRTAVSIPGSLLALHESSWVWLVAAYIVYWVGDMGDGWVARRMDEETVVGAVLDIVCDRACTTLAAAAFVHLAPDAAVPLAVFLLQFCVVDAMLSLAFLPFGLRSPNDFFLVDRRLHALNWSPPAKALNTSLVVLACIVGAHVTATVIALALLVVKSLSLHRLLAVLWPRHEAPEVGAGTPV